MTSCLYSRLEVIGGNGGDIKVILADFQGADFHMVWSSAFLFFRGSRFSPILYYQQLPITQYQVRFYANNYFE